MTRRIVALASALVVAAAVVVAAGQAGSAAAALETARKIELVDGNLAAAIEQYKAIVSQYGKTERTVAAQALLGMAAVYEKLGNAEARKVYEQIVRDYADQIDASTVARQRLSLSTTAPPAEPHLQCDSCLSGPQLTPDGRLLFMDRATGDLALRNLTTGTVRRLRLTQDNTGDGTFSDDYADRGVMSRDQRVAYLWWNSGTKLFELRVAATGQAGSTPRVLVNNPELPYIEPIGWSPDGQDILTLAWRNDRTAQIAWVSAKDGALRVVKSLDWRLNGVGGGGGVRPSLSPDGKYNAYAARAVNPRTSTPTASDPSELRIYVLASDGSTERETVNTGRFNEGPIWTPDGARLLFMSDRSSSLDLWSITVRDGAPAAQLSLVKAHMGQIEPLGVTASGTFYYTRRQPGVSNQVVVAPVDRSGRVAIRTWQQKVPGDRPTWSPDGKSLAYVRTQPSPGSVDTIVQSLATGEERAFSRGGLRGGGSARWLPDGSAFLQLAVADGGVLPSPQATNRVVAGAREWVVIDARTGESRRVLGATTDWQVLNGGAVLAPDGRTMYFAARSASSPAGTLDRVVAADLRTGTYKEAFVLPLAADALPAQGELSIGISPDGRHLSLVMQRIGTDDLRLARIGVDGQGYRELFGPYSFASPFDAPAEWTSDGKSILFLQNGSRQNLASAQRLMRISADGGQPEFTGLELEGLLTAAMSPDQTRIAFTTGPETGIGLWAIDNVVTPVGR